MRFPSLCLLAASAIVAAGTAGCYRPREHRPETRAVVFDSAFPLKTRIPLNTRPGDPLGMVGSVLARSDRVFILDPMMANIKVFYRDGRLANTFGGPGDGPGEFRNPVDMGFLSDGSVAVADARGRVSFFAPDGTYRSGWQSPMGIVHGFEVDSAEQSVALSGSILPGGRVPRAAGDYSVHLFSLAGEYRGSMLRKAVPMAPRESSFLGTMMERVDGMVITGNYSRNSIRHRDLHSRRQWTTAAAPGIYVSPDWKRSGHTLADAQRFSDSEMWMSGLIGLDCGRYLAALRKKVDRSIRYHYILRDRVGHDVLVTQLTPVTITGAADGDVYAVDLDDTPATLTVYAAPRANTCPASE